MSFHWSFTAKMFAVELALAAGMKAAQAAFNAWKKKQDEDIANETNKIFPEQVNRVLFHLAHTNDWYGFHNYLDQCGCPQREMIRNHLWKHFGGRC